MTSPTIRGSDGTRTAELASGVLQVYDNASPSQYSALTAGGVEAVNSSGTVILGQGIVNIYHNGGTGIAKIIAQATSSGGVLSISPILIDGTTGEIDATNFDATGVYKMDGTTIINSASAFVGAGVDVGANGVGCGGVNISGGYTGQTVTFNAFPTQMVFRGGVLTGYTP